MAENNPYVKDYICIRESQFTYRATLTRRRHVECENSHQSNHEECTRTMLEHFSASHWLTVVPRCSNIRNPWTFIRQEMFQHCSKMALTLSNFSAIRWGAMFKVGVPAKKCCIKEREFPILHRTPYLVIREKNIFTIYTNVQVNSLYLFSSCIVFLPLVPPSSFHSFVDRCGYNTSFQSIVCGWPDLLASCICHK